MQTSHASPGQSPRQQTGSCGSLLLVCQDSVTPPAQTPRADDQHAYGDLSAPDAAAAPLATPSVQVKEESRRGYDAEDACMDTQTEEEGDEEGEHVGEELDISFDSQFPDLISDLMTEEANPVAAHPPAATTAPIPPVFPAGIRYMVPPQPSPSSSFLPFPHPLPSSTRLASITDFSPEWSYPEVTNQVISYCQILLQ